MLSGDLELYLGVLQKSMPGSLLFLLFILDLGIDLNDVVITILIYVDDSRLIMNVDSRMFVELKTEKIMKIS